MDNSTLFDGPPQVVVDASPHVCPYLPNREAILPMRLPVRRVSSAEFAELLAQGDRRQGVLLYRPACHGCRACTPIRIEVDKFEPSSAQARAFRQGRNRLRVVLQRPQVDDERVDLYNRHRTLRGLDHGDEPIGELEYASFLVETCVDTWELGYYLDDRLVGIAIFDRAADALSAVYCHYRPDVPGLSIGVFSVMVHLELCRQWQLPYLYLGFVIDESRAMRYKAGYLPHQRLEGGVWHTVTRSQAES
ncbi:MAG: arginyltransferase [Deltaproteobacteria bacterium]|nr:arginyltransferase [Deltaproteobacteria bacterium]